MNPELLQFADVLVVPIIGGIIIWIWKLDERVFDLRASIIGREEFRNQMHEVRSEIAELRKVITNGRHQ